MKVLILRAKAEQERAQENWIKKRAALREEGKLPATPRPLLVPLRMKNRKHACGLPARHTLRLSIATQIALEITSSF